MTNSPIEYFGPPSFWPGQREGMEKTEDAFENGYKFVLLEAPTGSGKSEIAAAFARQSQSSHILTPQKILQDQYEKQFGNEMVIMKGRGSYPCITKGYEGYSCKEGLCRRKVNVDENGNKKRIAHHYCPYRKALAKAEASLITIHNFDSFYYQNLTGSFQDQRDLIIIDECHNIEAKFLNFIEFTFSSKRDDFEIPELKSMKEYAEFVWDRLEIYKRDRDLLEEKKKISALEDDDLERLDHCISQIQKLEIFLDTWEQKEYVFDYKKKKDFQTVIFKPVFIDDFARAWLFPKGDRFLMMSATILDQEIFCKAIGLNSHDAKFIRIPSHFPRENRPIKLKYIGNMSLNSRDKSFPQLVEGIKQILAKHPYQRGIIQTHNDAIACYLKDHLKNPRLTFRTDFQDVSEMIEAHKKKPNSVIVASGLREGLDLFGDLSEFQVICKVPYLPLGDKQVARRKELDPKWYNFKAVLNFVQILGRSVRSESDKVTTYLLDSYFDPFLQENKDRIPLYIREAFPFLART